MPWPCALSCARNTASTRRPDILCHAEGYRAGIASNHADVEHWFPRHGKTMDDFRAAVKAALGGGRSDGAGGAPAARRGQACRLGRGGLGLGAGHGFDGRHPAPHNITRQEVAVMFKRFYEAIKAGK